MVEGTVKTSSSSATLLEVGVYTASVVQITSRRYVVSTRKAVFHGVFVVVKIGS